MQRLQSPAAIVMFVSLVVVPRPAPAGTPAVPPGFQVEIVSGLINSPVAFVFLTPNDMLVCEKSTGRVRRVINGVPQGFVLDLPVNAVVERGLLGIALHPDFAQNNYVYLYYSRAAADGAAWIENRVARFTWTGAALTTETLIIAFPDDPAQPNDANHNGGVILFGPDGKLYGVTGDLNRRRTEQNLVHAQSAGVGGVFRLNDDGSIPADNPFALHPDPAIRPLYSYGVRNSFGLGFDPLTGVLWDTENGVTDYDEINLVPAGHNSGWVRIMGPADRDAQGTADLITLPGGVYSDPEFSFRQAIGVTSLLILQSPRYPAALQNCMFIGDYRTGSLFRLPLNAARDGFLLPGDLADLVADSPAERDPLVWATGFSITTDLKLGPDGFLYICGYADGLIRRIVPLRADTNCDAVVDFFDIDPFLLALFDAPGYAAAYPACFVLSADVNRDGVVDFFDIDSFLNELFDA